MKGKFSEIIEVALYKGTEQLYAQKFGDLVAVQAKNEVGEYVVSVNSQYGYIATRAFKTFAKAKNLAVKLQEFFAAEGVANCEVIPKMKNDWDFHERFKRLVANG